MKNEQQIDLSKAPRLSGNFKPSRFAVTTACADHARRRVRVELPRHKHCLTRRNLLAALRQAELSEWLASGGDFLKRMPQPVY
jgi:hypothetical protein